MLLSNLGGVTHLKEEDWALCVGKEIFTDMQMSFRVGISTKASINNRKFLA